MLTYIKDHLDAVEVEDLLFFDPDIDPKLDPTQYKVFLNPQLYKVFEPYNTRSLNPKP